MPLCTELPRPLTCPTAHARNHMATNIATASFAMASQQACQQAPAGIHDLHSQV